MIEVKTAFTVLLTASLLGIAACGGNGGDEVRTVTVKTPAEAEQAAPVTGDAILIETRISSARKHAGESRRVRYRRVGILRGRQDQGRQHGCGDHRDVPLSRRPPDGQLLTDATIAGAEQRLGDRERHRQLQRSARRRLDGGQLRRRRSGEGRGDLHRGGHPIARRPEDKPAVGAGASTPVAAREVPSRDSGIWGRLRRQPKVLWARLTAVPRCSGIWGRLRTT